MGLCVGATRVDIAVINGAISGYEIKSDRDTLNRLPGQVALYDLVLDAAWVVTTNRYAARVEAHISPWWGVLGVERQANETVAFHILRSAAWNDTKQEPMAIAQLLWRDEALEELQAIDAHRGLSRATRWGVWERLVDSMELADLKATVRRRLKERPSWPGGQ